LARIEKLLLAEQTHPPETLTVEIVCRKRAQTDVWHICVDCPAWPTWNYTEKWLELTSVDPDTICIQCFQRRRDAAYVIRERSMTWGVGFSRLASRRGVSSKRSISSIGEELSKIGHELHISGLTLATLGTVQFLL
jgi:hypothetical protein